MHPEIIVRERAKRTPSTAPVLPHGPGFDIHRDLELDIEGTCICGHTLLNCPNYKEISKQLEVELSRLDLNMGILCVKSIFIICKLPVVQSRQPTLSVSHCP